MYDYIDMGMHQGNSDERIILLINKLNKGTASESERREIDEWYDHPASAAKYGDGMSLSQKTRAKDRIFQHINAQIDLHRPIPHRRVSFPLIRSMSIAAVLLLIIGAGLFYFNPKGKQSTSEVQGTSYGVNHNTSKAFLTLANGRQIVLTGAKNGMLASQGSVTINKKTSGQIVYRADDQKTGATEFNSMTTMRGGEYRLTLADGTNVWLNAASSLRYPTIFSGKNREVELSGEAYFEVAHDAAHPFRVVTKKQTIEVLGTHFNINAYDNELVSKTTLLQGAVRVMVRGASRTLKPGQQAAVTLNKINLENVDVREAVAWKDGFFEFTDTDIQTIMRQISRWYDVDVVYDGKITGETFTGRVSKFLSVNQVLKLVQSPGVHITYEGRRIMVKE